MTESEVHSAPPLPEVPILNVVPPPEPAASSSEQQQPAAAAASKGSSNVEIDKKTSKVCFRQHCQSPHHDASHLGLTVSNDNTRKLSGSKSPSLASSSSSKRRPSSKQSIRTRARHISKQKEEAMMLVDPAVSAKVPVPVLRKSRTGLTEAPPDDASTKDKLKWQVRKILASQRFDSFIGIIICVNSVTIGLQMTYEVEGRDTTIFNILEHIFLLTYVSELGLRFFSCGRSCLLSNWVRFDLCLVGLGVASTWIIEPILTAVVSGKSRSDELLAPVLVLRVLRLLRLARSVRLLVQFKTLWMLVRGLLASAGTMLYTFVLMVLILYVFACLAIELITKNESLSNDESLDSLVHERFSSISVSMLTLVQFVTLDDASQIYIPFMRRSPFILGAYFMIFIIVVSICLMNLVTAVIVEAAIEQSNQDREVQKAYENQRVAALVPAIKRLFDELDVDGSGDLSLDEINNADEDVKAELQKIMSIDHLATLHEVADEDGDGEISIDEFCNAITRTITSEEPIEFVRLKQQLQLGRRETHIVDKQLTDVVECVEQLTKRVAHIKNEFGESPNGSMGRNSSLKDMVLQQDEAIRCLAEQREKKPDPNSRRLCQVEEATKRMEATLELLATHILGVQAPLPDLFSDSDDDESGPGHDISGHQYASLESLVSIISDDESGAGQDVSGPQYATLESLVSIM